MASHDDLWSAPADATPAATAREAALAARVDELEVRLAFLEQGIATLTESVTALQLQRERDQRHLGGLLDELGQLRGQLMRDMLGDPSSEPPPPHY